jgi:hypothetical protein
MGPKVWWRKRRRRRENAILMIGTRFTNLKKLKFLLFCFLNIQLCARIILRSWFIWSKKSYFDELRSSIFQCDVISGRLSTIMKMSSPISNFDRVATLLLLAFFLPLVVGDDVDEINLSDNWQQTTDRQTTSSLFSWMNYLGRKWSVIVFLARNLNTDPLAEQLLTEIIWWKMYIFLIWRKSIFRPPEIWHLIFLVRTSSRSSQWLWEIGTKCNLKQFTTFLWRLWRIHFEFILPAVDARLFYKFWILSFNVYSYSV